MKSLLRHKLAILACSACWALPLALTAQVPVPNLISHQGRVSVSENPGDPPVNFNGNGQFKFALVNDGGSTSYWTNAPDTAPADGVPDTAVSLTVTKGLYSVMLGDTELPNMAEIPATVFQNDDVRLRAWFNDGTHEFQLLSPDQRLAPNGYLPAGAVAAGSLADGSITSAKIAPGMVIPSQAVADSSHTMDANTSYAATGIGITSFTLPATASVGDVAEVRGIGPGGWSVLPSVGNNILAPWIPRESHRLWLSVASSADGSKLVAGVNGGQIYTSKDSGVTWTAREINRAWNSIASSADGSKLVAVDGSLGRIYTSTDSGVTWTARGPNRYWSSVASSADGSKLVAVNGMHFYTSNDSGVTWTQRLTELGGPLFVASSADGTKLAATAYGGQIYISADSGVTWTARDSKRQWWSVASSADGSKLVAVVSNGQIYTSNASVT